MKSKLRKQAVKEQNRVLAASGSQETSRKTIVVASSSGLNLFEGDNLIDDSLFERVSEKLRRYQKRQDLGRTYLTN